MALCGVIEAIPCPTMDPGFWTPWLDRDSPSGVGDFENIANYYPSGSPCNDGSEALYIQCRVADTQTPWYDLPYSDKLTCTTESGFECINADILQTCPNFAVRFYCGYTYCSEQTTCPFLGTDHTKCQPLFFLVWVGNGGLIWFVIFLGDGLLLPCRRVASTVAGTEQLLQFDVIIDRQIDISAPSFPSDSTYTTYTT